MGALMLEVLLPERHCLRCGDDLKDRKKTAKTCGDSCRHRHWQRLNPGRRPRRGGVPLYNGNGRPRRPRNPSRQTTYAVVRRDGPVVEILCLVTGKSKRAVEGELGITKRLDLAAIADRSLPAVV